MKTLNELTPNERLELYKKALVDWTERPNDIDANTHRGLCYYFRSKYGIVCERTDSHEWVIHIKEKMKQTKRLAYIDALGIPSARIAALNAMIKELEEAQ